MPRQATGDLNAPYMYLPAVLACTPGAEVCTNCTVDAATYGAGAKPVFINIACKPDRWGRPANMWTALPRSPGDYKFVQVGQGLSQVPCWHAQVPPAAQELVPTGAAPLVSAHCRS